MGEQIARAQSVGSLAADQHGARVGSPEPDDRPEQRGLARAVAAHDRDDLAGHDRQVDAGQRRLQPVPHRDARAAGPGRHPPVPPPRRRAAAGGATSSRRERRVAAWRRASRTDNGRGSQPASRPSSTTGGTTGRARQDHLGEPVHQAPVPGEPDHAVGVLHHALEAVLGEQDRQPQVVHQALQRGQDVLGRPRVERRRRLVEHDDAGDGSVSTEPMATRWRSPPDSVRSGRSLRCGQAEQVEGLLHALAHHVGGQPERLHAVGELVLDHVGDEPGERVLARRPPPRRPGRAGGGCSCRGRRRRPDRPASRR